MDPIDLWRAADVLLKLYTPREAMERARARANELLAQDDVEGFFVWARIGVAILDLAIEKPSASEPRN